MVVLKLPTFSPTATRLSWSLSRFFWLRWLDRGRASRPVVGVCGGCRASFRSPGSTSPDISEIAPLRRSDRIGRGSPPRGFHPPRCNRRVRAPRRALRDARSCGRSARRAHPGPCPAWADGVPPRETPHRKADAHKAPESVGMDRRNAFALRGFGSRR